MLRLRVMSYWASVFLLLSCSGGCYQVDNPLDEEKNMHFQRGRELASSQDYTDAAQEFEKALEDNPRSAAAHFELGWLYDTKLTDYAAAIYHYERHLELRADSKRASLIKERIRGCKQQLANSEFPLPSTRDLQREVDRLNAENQMLKQQLQAFAGQRIAAPTVAVVAPPTQATPTRVEPARYAADTLAQSTPTPPAHSRTHIVRAHETLTSIAAEHGVKTSALMAANPQTDPRRLRVGQSVNLP
jgi:LysM repeat protein